MAQAQWLLGTLDQSTQTLCSVVADTAHGDHPLSLSYALTYALNTLSFARFTATAEPWIAWLKDHAGRHAMNSYYSCALGFDGLLQTQRGNFAAGEQLLRACLEGSRKAQFEVLYGRFLSGLAEALVAAKRFDESLAVIDEALELDHVPLWAFRPEALRIKGEILLYSDKADMKQAEDQFLRSLDVAREQGALFWELRTTMSLARLHHAQGQTNKARYLLQSIYARFTEGFATADLPSAKRLLDEWGPGDASDRDF
jgi:predicted ATPase